MRVKEFFMLARTLPDEIRRIRARRQVYLEMAANITAGAGELPCRTGEVHSKVEKAALGLLELAQRLGDQAAQYESIIRDTEQVISCLTNPRHRQVLSLRYMERRTWEAIAAEMGVSDERNLRRCHGRALKAAEKYTPEYVRNADGPCMPPFMCDTIKMP